MAEQDIITLKGVVIIQKFAEGSKSEHDAVYLDTGKKQYRLKKRGGNPFYDESLHKLIGHLVILKGILNPYFFEITEIEEILE